jgi:hypothetical protein
VLLSLPRIVVDRLASRGAGVDSPRLCTGESMAVAAQRFSSTPKTDNPPHPAHLEGREAAERALRI